ncbi:hypothetical protein [Archangium sp.]|uniref:hypothetical protein n=1 Tax=Archangium sp. TaxID=1872627 RepID=UPI002ED9D69A
MPLKPGQLLHSLPSLLLSTALGCASPTWAQGTSQALASNAQRLSAPGLPPGLTPSLVKDIHAPEPSLDQGSWVDSPGAPVSVGSTLYFLAREPSKGIEPWLTDGTQQGTRLVAEIVPGLNSSGITGLAALGNTVFVSTAPSVFNGTLCMGASCGRAMAPPRAPSSSRTPTRSSPTPGPTA